jgi:excinuclease ABC subunit B
MTDSMSRAIDETNRRRAKQIAYNEENDIEPVSIIKEIRDLTDQVTAQHALAEEGADYHALTPGQLPKDELARLIKDLEKRMRESAEALEFEKAAMLRDQIFELRETLAEKENIPPWKRARALAGQEDF